MKNKNLKFYPFGFGTVELLVTIVVVSLGLVSLLSLTAKIVEAGNASKINIISLNLAREGEEVLRNMRDSNWLAGRTWDDNLPQGIDHTAILKFLPALNIWQLDYSVDTIDNVRAKLSFDDNKKLYLHDDDGSLLLTPFSRLLEIDLICFNPLVGTEIIRTDQSNCSIGEQKIGVLITSTVRWTDGTRTRQTVLINKLYNWR